MYAKRHAGRISDKGELVLSDPAGWRADVSRHKGRDVFVTVVRQQHQRSPNQNKYYWGVVVEEIANYIGESREETHELLKQAHLPERPIELLDGKHLTMPPTTKTLNVEEFAAYVERCKRWAAEFLGLVIPDAGQVQVRL